MGGYYAVERTGEYLEHYGVLGMRWGIRHDRRVKYAKSRYKTVKKQMKKDRNLSDDQKARKVGKAREDWMQEREAAANRLYTLNSKGVNRKLARQSSAKTLAKTGLMGSYGALTYDRLRDKGVNKLASGVADNYLYNAPGTAEYFYQRRLRKKKS